MRHFVKRREQIRDALPKGSALVLESWPVFFRQPDVPHPYRQESGFYFLSGFPEPESLLALTKDSSLLFIRNKDPLREVWDGPRWTAAKAQSAFLMDEAHHMACMEEILARRLKGVKTVYASLFKGSFVRKKGLLKGMKIKSAADFLAPFRQIKSAKETACLRAAIAATGEAHKAAGRALRPGVSERALHGVFLKEIMERGCDREGYPSIVASGKNAVTLHYSQNQSICKAGELLLLDAGGEKNFYTADITRVYPANGAFSKIQAEVYEMLLRLQKSLIQEVRPGASWRALNQKMLEGAAQILIDLKALKGPLKSRIEDRSARLYLPHTLGHHLGLDVHDPPFPKNSPGLLKKGMILTVEPGLYFPKSCPVPALRGIGMRIEDNILVTAKGFENLSQAIPKEIEDVHALCQEA